MKKKIPLIILATLLIAILPIAQGESIVDNYPQDNYSSTRAITAVHPSAGASGSALSQAFTGNGLNLIAATFYIAKQGSPAGYLKAALYNATGTFGTNAKPDTLIETSTNAISMATLNSLPSFNNQIFNFTSTVTLTNTTKYCIALYVENATTIDGSNYVGVGADNTSPTHNGNRAYFTNSVWTGENTIDLIFYIYGEAAPEPTPSPTPTPTATPSPVTPTQTQNPLYNNFSTPIVALAIIAAIILLIVTLISKIKPII